MHYISTRNNKIKESFSSILFQGLSKDGGLYLPSHWPQIPINKLKGKTYSEIAFEVIYPFLEEDFNEDKIKKIISKTYEIFEHDKIAPILQIDKNKYILELFYGPTLAFKDYALQFLGNLFFSLISHKDKKITVLGATSGDTGSAAIEAFKGSELIQVFILHPYGKVSEMQRRQMTTIEETNVHNIAIKGTFDDCQNIVKELFLDNDLQSSTSLTAINSINWARIIAQSVYYFWAYSQINRDEISFVVPSGNFGNIFSARVAKYMGLPIKNLHIVTNENDILHRTIKEGNMKIQKVKQTYSPSMDIQISSNFERQLFESSERDSDLLNEIILSFIAKGEQKIPEKVLKDLRNNYLTHSVSNSETLSIIKEYYDKHEYLADPHTATGLHVMDKLENNHPTVSLACAHPAKFSNAINEAIKTNPSIPKRLKNIFDKNEKMIILDNNSELVKSEVLKSI